jgi:hypothetical protein
MPNLRHDSVARPRASFLDSYAIGSSPGSIIGVFSLTEGGTGVSIDDSTSGVLVLPNDASLAITGRAREISSGVCGKRSACFGHKNRTL